MAVFESAIFWIIIAAASEIIALTPLMSNSVVQLVLVLLTQSSLEKRTDLHTGGRVLALQV